MSTWRTWVSGGMLAIFVGVLCGCGSASSQIQISPTSALLAPGQTFQFKVVVDVPNVPQFLWQVNGVIGGSPSTGTITTEGVYTAPATVAKEPILINVRDQAAHATVSLFDPNLPNQGVVAATQNPLVAAYTIPVPSGASAQVQFGTETSYGLTTSVVAPPAGETATILVAGMRESTPYHMRAVVNFADGSKYTDADHTFVTGAIPTDLRPDISAQLTGVGTPSPGIELLSLYPTSSANLLYAVATDLAGNVIWYYKLPNGAYPFPIKLLPNGHMLIVTGGTVNDVREIDLAGNIIHQITVDSIDASLANLASFRIGTLNHDILALPNGHLILLASIAQTINDSPGIPAPTAVTGNALIDWDPQLGAVWTWSTFDHLDLTHAPYGVSDWTHGNAVIYSPDDGDLIFSMRNQNWVVKINYADGSGDGKILWRLGPDGDFSLPAQEQPFEWNYGQHYVSIQSPNSSGIFSIMFFNNGNNRLMNSKGDVCGSLGVGACYSSVPIFELNEYTKEARVTWEDKLGPAYSICCGDALVLPNGNVEFDVAFDQNTPNVSYIEEVTRTDNPELIWRMNITGELAYRGFRIPSLYPGQVWSAEVGQPVGIADVHY